MSERNSGVPQTAAEKASWVLFGIATGVVLVAWVIFRLQSESYDGEPEAAFAVMIAAIPLIGLGLVPALILTGIRQLLPALRSRTVDDADAASDDAHDGGGDAAGGEDLRGDVGEPDPGYTRSQR